jgi:hypothetical protein
MSDSDETCALEVFRSTMRSPVDGWSTGTQRIKWCLTSRNHFQKSPRTTRQAFTNMLGGSTPLVELHGSAPGFAPPKTKASYRTIPLPQVVGDALAAHLAAYPVGDGGLTSRTTTAGRAAGPVLGPLGSTRSTTISATTTPAC